MFKISLAIFVVTIIYCATSALGIVCIGAEIVKPVRTFWWMCEYPRYTLKLLPTCAISANPWVQHRLVFATRRQ